MPVKALQDKPHNLDVSLTAPPPHSLPSSGPTLLKILSVHASHVDSIFRMNIIGINLNNGFGLCYHPVQYSQAVCRKEDKDIS